MIIGLKFDHAKTGMETTHALLVANIKSIPKEFRPGMNFSVFLSALPEEAIIGDAFLGVSYIRDKIPQIVTDYVKAYGGSMSLSTVFHMRNFSLSVFGSYIIHAWNAAMQIQNPFIVVEPKKLDHDTTLISRLKETTGIELTGVRDAEYYVYAQGALNSKIKMHQAFKLQSLLGENTVTFFKTRENKAPSIMIERLNEPEIANKVTEAIKHL